MIADKIRSAGAALGVLAGQVTDEQWGLIACIRRELADAADQTEAVEQSLTVDMEEGFRAEMQAARGE